MSAQSYFSTRIVSIWQTRGGFGFFRFLMTRFLRTQSDMVFERNLLEPEPPPTFGSDRQIIVIERDNLDQPDLEDVVAQLLEAESSIYRAGLEHDDIAFAVIDEKRQLLHRSFVQFETRYKTLLGETDDVPLLTNCHTVPTARGERLYPKTLLHAGALLAERGYDRMIITCDERNQASIRGIIRGGFQQKRVIQSLVILARFALQKIADEHDVRWRLVCL
ncbi:MAG: hypothetical protein ACR2QF_17670 [Geminicoccaceae bacterium]